MSIKNQIKRTIIPRDTVTVERDGIHLDFTFRTDIDAEMKTMVELMDEARAAIQEKRDARKDKKYGAV